MPPDKSAPRCETRHAQPLQTLKFPSEYPLTQLNLEVEYTVMKIDNSITTLTQMSGLKDYRNPVNNSQGPQQATPSTDRAESTGGPGQSKQSDTATLTPDASLLRSVEAKISALPIVDTGRVERVQSAIESDHFRINPTEVAKKLFNLEVSLHHARA